MTPRSVIAVACLLGGVVAAPTGAYLAWGLGLALLVLASALFIVALLLGWDA